MYREAELVRLLTFARIWVKSLVKGGDPTICILLCSSQYRFLVARVLMLLCALDFFSAF